MVIWTTERIRQKDYVGKYGEERVYDTKWWEIAMAMKKEKDKDNETKNEEEKNETKVDVSSQPIPLSSPFPSLSPPLSILDLCSGSGNIALSLAHSFPNSTVIGIDRNTEAIELANENRMTLDIKRCRFIEDDVQRLCEVAVDETFDMDSLLHTPSLPPSPSIYPPFDLCISNPPYIPPHQWSTLQFEVQQWEDIHALVAENGGTALYEYIIKATPRLLYPIPRLPSIPEIVLEIGSSAQIVPINSMLKRCGFQHVTVHENMDGHVQWMAACRFKK